MVVDDLHFERVASAKLEADSPRAVDDHRPLTLTVTTQLVQADALQGTQVLQRSCRIERREKLACSVRIQAPELRGLAVFRKAARCGALQDRIIT